ncbi:MAG: class I SAM-dependent methyltransferase [Vicinamibacterales bacterium]
MTTFVNCDPRQQPPSPLAAIKARQQATWASGDFAVIGTTLQIVGEQLCEAADVRSLERVLDVAAGNGNATLAAARRFADVTSTDYVPALLERGRARAEAEGLAVRFQTADAEALPFDDAAFDVVLSTFGVMFAPDHDAAAREMARVCRPGGRIAMANWTPDGFIGTLFPVVARYAPPPAGLRPPSLWGTPAHVDALLGPARPESRTRCAPTCSATGRPRTSWTSSGSTRPHPPRVRRPRCRRAAGVRGRPAGVCRRVEPG